MPENAAAKPRKRWMALLVGGAAIVALILVLANRDQSPEVAVAQVTRGDLSSSITSNGKVEPIDPFIAHAQFPTFIEKLNATEGQPVHKGQVILTLNAESEKAQLAATQSDLLTAEQKLRNAKAGGPPEQVAQVNGDLEKAKINLASLEKIQKSLEQLVASKAATQQELDQNAAKLADARATVQVLEQKKAALAAEAGVNAQGAQLEAQHDRELIATLQRNIASAVVTAPFDGTLYSLPVHLGDYVQIGNTLAEIANLHRVRVRAYVDEPDLGVLQAGQPVQITWDGLPGHTWTGKTEDVPKQVVPLGVRSVGQVLCSIDNSSLQLIPNVNVDVRIIVAEAQNALIIPRGAVHIQGQEKVVFVVQDGNLKQRAVQIGISNPTNFQVLAGLKEGERVAVASDINLRDGMSIHPVEAGRK